MSKKIDGVKRWAILSGIAFQMGIIIYLFVQLGKWLDTTYNAGNRSYLMICTLVGVGVSLFLVVKQTKDLNS
jgi:Putative F0F1-ATPase subunit Ca2+/Mg2+ transporter